MPCYYPIDGFHSRTGGITFTKKDAWVDRPVTVPCGRCIGCRLEHSRQWAMRCMHEASLYDQNCFATLTYSPQFMPENGSLQIRDHQLFMKKLRKQHPESKIRFFMCGEYGKTGITHPHYHYLLFNFDFSDKEQIEDAPSGEKQWTSETLDKIWGYGRCTLGNVTFASAGYVARYTLKKITGKAAAAYYGNLQPPFSAMSRGGRGKGQGGIGAPWLNKWGGDVYPHDYVVINGKKVKPPKFYDKLQSEDYQQSLRARRIRSAKKTIDPHEQSKERLAVKEEIQQRRIDEHLPRKI